MLDLYHGFWEGQPLGPKDQVISADEKTSIQARPCQVVPVGPDGSSTTTGGAEPSDPWPPGTCGAASPGAAVRARPASPPSIAWSPRPYVESPIVRPLGCAESNGSSHRGHRRPTSVSARSQPDAHLVHASGLNQVEIFLCIVSRTVPMPAVAGDPMELALPILTLDAGDRLDPRPFRWRDTARASSAEGANCPTHRRMTLAGFCRGPFGQGLSDVKHLSRAAGWERAWSCRRPSKTR